MLPKTICLILAVFAFAVCAVRADESDKKNAAIAAATSWLKLVDEGKYSESWMEAAAYFKSAVTQQQWDQSLQAVRRPLGSRLSRSVQNATYTKALPGAPDGEYVVIQFTTSFANKKTAIETVTPLLEKDGTWKVSGYYIK